MNTENEELSKTPPMPVRALIVLVFSLLAAWLAAGSLGWLAPPLQRSLTWLAIAGIVMTAIPGPRRLSLNDGILLGGATLIALLMTASSLAVVNILAVAVLLAAVSQVRSGSIGQVSGAATLAITGLAVCRLVYDGSAAAWLLANGAGRWEGLWAGWLTGRPLLIGASFGGLDFLVLMAGLAVAWLIASPPPRAARAAWAVAMIILAQTAYLAALAFNHDLAALLPPQIVAKPNSISNLGIWTWGNAIRAFLPWNLPVLAALFHCAVAVGMFRLGGFPAAADDLPAESDEQPAAAEGKRRNRGIQGQPPLAADWMNSEISWRRFGPAGLMVVAAAALMLTTVKPDLAGRRIVAYDDGATDWSTTDPGTTSPERPSHYGLLPVLVKSLGGEFIRSRDLAEADLREADVLIVLPPRSGANPAAADPSIPEEIQSRIWRYVNAGGRLIVGGEPETTLGAKENVLNELLQPAAMWFRDDTANSLTRRWEDNLQPASHAATSGSSTGRSQFSLDQAASIHVSWPAGPLLVGRWSWDEVGNDPDRPEALPYAPGNRLGDMVLAAQQNVGQGTVVALGSAACLSNDDLPFSYNFTTPLLCSLSANQSSPLAWWRQLLGVIAAGAAVVLLFREFEPLRVAAATAALALAMLACNWYSNSTAGILPLGDKEGGRPIIYVDGSHLGPTGKDPWGKNGIGRLMRVLAANDYLPLLAPDLSPQRLKHAAMLISIAPARSFGSSEIAAVDEFVQKGGFFLSMVGSPEAEPSQTVLAQFHLHIAPSPLPPWIDQPETEPIGRYYYPKESQPMVQFNAAWPVIRVPGGETWPKDNPRESIITGKRIGQGQAFLVGDTTFALNKNFESSPPNANFWRVQLQSWLGHGGEKSPPGLGEKGVIKLPATSDEKRATP